MDLNADLGELAGETGRSLDAALLALVTSANVACGGHAGDAASMRRVCTTAAEHGVVVGAHPSYVDREHFGRRALDVAPVTLREQLAEQIGALRDAARVAGTRVRYVKPHGALYHRVATDADAAGALVGAVVDVLAGPQAGPDPIALVGPPGAVSLDLARDAGLATVAEGFADRAYRADGSLVPRGQDGAVLHDPEAVVAQAVALAQGTSIATRDGAPLRLDVGTLCLHGDTPDAVTLVRRVRAALTEAGIVPVAFAA